MDLRKLDEPLHAMTKGQYDKFLERNPGRVVNWKPQVRHDMAKSKGYIPEN